MKLQRSLASSAGPSTTLWLPMNRTVRSPVAELGPQEGVWLEVTKARPLPP